MRLKSIFCSDKKTNEKRNIKIKEKFKKRSKQKGISIVPIKSCYLVDFENVNENGILSAENLRKNDHVYIFSTKNAPKVSLKVLSKFNHCDLRIFTVPAGKESLDRQLIAFLGYLAGKYSNKYRYVIVSKDTGYDVAIEFLKNTVFQNQLDITRIRQISSISNKKKGSAGESLATVQTEKKSSSASARAKVQNQKKRQVLMEKQTNIQNALLKESFDDELIKHVIKLYKRHSEKKKSKKKNIQNALLQSLTAKYGTEKGRKAYGCIKDIL